jgi:hypothetical protein
MNGTPVGPTVPAPCRRLPSRPRRLRPFSCPRRPRRRTPLIQQWAATPVLCRNRSFHGSYRRPVSHCLPRSGRERTRRRSGTVRAADQGGCILPCRPPAVPSRPSSRNSQVDGGRHPLGRAVVTRQGARCEPQAPLSGAGKLCRALVRWRHQELLLLAPGTEFRLGAVCVLLDDGRSACFPECGGEPNASKRQLVSAGAAQNLGG